MIERVQEKLQIPEGVTVTVADGVINAKGTFGEASKALFHPRISISVESSQVIVKSEKCTKREKKLVYTYAAHIKNLIKGAHEGFTYKVKVCSSHFPMNVTVTDKEISVKNFFGEAVPRKLALKQGAKVKLDGEIITIEGSDKELCGQIAADLEQLTRVTNRDRRIFQDGLYIIEKAGKPV